ncbi:MAG: ribonuclease HI [Candidatus Pacebacteria bacterium]|nr:ribonuclease HI [Candidatus Paceibacterota bacterium]
MNKNIDHVRSRSPQGDRSTRLIAGAASNVVEIFTDGSSLGNPGPGGWGVVIIKNEELGIKNEKKETIIKEFGGFDKNTTNNRMELQAVIETLKHIIKKHESDTIVIHTDSTYVLLGITTWIHNWEKNNWKTANKKPVLNKELWQELIELVRNFKGKLSWQKVKGHNGHIHNERADEIATDCSASQKTHTF